MFGIVLFVAADGHSANRHTIVLHQRPESAGDTRNKYHVALLRAALVTTETKYGTFVLAPAAKVMNELRIVRLLAAGSTEVDTGQI